MLINFFGEAPNKSFRKTLGFSALSGPGIKGKKKEQYYSIWQKSLSFQCLSHPPSAWALNPSPFLAFSLIQSFVHNVMSSPQTVPLLAMPSFLSSACLGPSHPSRPVWSCTTSMTLSPTHSDFHLFVILVILKLIPHTLLALNFFYYFHEHQLCLTSLLALLLESTVLLHTGRSSVNTGWWWVTGKMASPSSIGGLATMTIFQGLSDYRVNWKEEFWSWNLEVKLQQEGDLSC